VPAARALLVLALVALPAGLGAQLPITLGRPVVGRLLRTDPVWSDSSHYKMYAFVGNKGDTITAELTSDDFDANVVLMDASGNVLRKDDDGGGNCNARLSYVLPSAANYRVYANSSAPAELGEYQLTVVRGKRPAVSDSSCRGFGRVAGMIQVGQTVNGRLTDDDPMLTDTTHFQRWILPVQLNQTFTVDLISQDFDPYMRLARGRDEKLVDNDDGGGGCNARIVYTASDDHPLRIIVNTVGAKRATGSFVLKVTDGELPTEAKGNCRFSGGAATSASAPAPSRPSRSGESGRGGTITVGQSVTGELTTADELFTDTTYMQHWKFTATPGQDVTIDLASDDFDPFIMVDGPGLTEFVGDEHSGPGCAARISRTFPQAGPYDIQVNTTTHPRRQTGHFVLSITQGHKGDVNDSCSPPTGAGGGGLQSSEGPLVRSGDNSGAAPSEHHISVGQSVQGRLATSDVLLRSDSTYAQAWTIQARAGQTITIDLESEDFDAYLFVRGPGISSGRDFQDDDSGGNCNARLTVTFPESGDYDLVVNTQGKYATGAFSISVTTGSKPKSLARCSRGG
jgi:pre-peptidase